MIYCQNKTQLAQSVKHLLQNSSPGSLRTMIMLRDISGACYVLDATDSVSEGTAKELTQTFYEELSNISKQTTPVG
jgi:hypothetical protein